MAGAPLLVGVSAPTSLAVRAADDLRTNDGLNVEVIWDGPLRERDALAQFRIVDRRVSAGADAIVIAPQHSQTMVAPVERAVAQGIPVVIIDSGLERPDVTVKYVATDNRNGGRLAAKRLFVGKRAGVIDEMSAEGLSAGDAPPS